MRRFVGLRRILAGAGVLPLLVACSALGGGADVPDRLGGCASSPNDCNTGARGNGGTFAVALSEAPTTFNVDSADGAVTDTETVMNSLLPSAYQVLPDGSFVLNPDLVSSATVTSSSPQTVEYRLAAGAVWDDGTPISADDFAYAWHTQNGRDCPQCSVAGTAGYEDISSVAGSGSTVTVTFAVPYPDWPSLFDDLYPAHVEGAGLDLSTKDGLAVAFLRQGHQPTWSGGPYRIDSYAIGKRLDLVPNRRWYGADKPTLSRVTYRFLADQSRMVAALQSGDVNAFTAPPSTDLLDVIGGLSRDGVHYAETAGPAWERLDLNVRNPYLSDLSLRQAILDTIDVDAILDQVVRGYDPGVKRLYSHNLLAGAPGYQEVVKQAGPDQGTGSLSAAKTVLSQAGYVIKGGRLTLDGRAVPALRLRYSQGNDARVRTGQLIKAQLAKLGVPVTLEPTDDLASTLASGDYDLAEYSWVGSRLQTASREMWATTGGNNHTGWGDPDSDALLKQVARELDPQQAYDELNQQDAILTQAAVVLPLYQKPDLLVLAGSYVNVRDNVPGGISYNAQQWGTAGAAPLSTAASGSS